MSEDHAPDEQTLAQQIVDRGKACDIDLDTDRALALARHMGRVMNAESSLHLTSIKTARYFEMGERDVIVTVATASADMYRSRLVEARDRHGDYGEVDAACDRERNLLGVGIDHMLELSYWDRKRMHNLKYFTWVEQFGKPVEELDAQWEDPAYWTSRFHAWRDLDDRIREVGFETELHETLGCLMAFNIGRKPA